MLDCRLPLIKPPQWAFLPKFLQHLLNYHIWSQSITRKPEMGTILPLLPCSAPEIHVPLCFQTAVIAEPCFEIKAREQLTSIKYMSSNETAASKRAMKPLTSVTASHRNQVPLDTVYQCAQHSQGVVEEKKCYLRNFSQCLTTLKYMKA